MTGYSLGMLDLGWGGSFGIIDSGWLIGGD
jgi:hypothetical protein